MQDLEGNHNITHKAPLPYEVGTALMLEGNNNYLYSSQ